MPYILTQTPLLLTYLEKWHKQAFEKKRAKRGHMPNSLYFSSP